MPPSRGYTRRSRTVFGTMTCATRSKREVALIQWELPFHSVGVLLPFFYSFFSFGELLISQSGSVGIVDFGCSIATLTRCNTYKHYVMDLQFFASPPILVRVCPSHTSCRSHKLTWIPSLQMFWTLFSQTSMIFPTNVDGTTMKSARVNFSSRFPNLAGTCADTHYRGYSARSTMRVVRTAPSGLRASGPSFGDQLFLMYYYILFTIYCSTVHIRDNSIWITERILLLPAMYDALPTMQSLTNVTLRLQQPVPAELLHALSLAPRLTCLDIHDARFDGTAEYSTLPFATLDSLSISIAGFRGALRKRDIDHARETRNVVAFLKNISHSLPALRISGDLLSPDFLSLWWLELRSFTVTEHTPTPFIPSLLLTA
jgi:hypothetical protein